MPEKDIHVWELLTAIGATLTTTIWLFFGIRKADAEKIEEIDNELQAVKVDLAKNYASNPAMKNCSDAITKSVEEGFRRHAAEMKLVIHDAVDMATERRNKKGNEAQR